MQILREISQSNFVVIITDETSNVSNIFQLAFVLPYEYEGKAKGRFRDFNTASHSAESVASVISEKIRNPRF